MRRLNGSERQTLRTWALKQKSEGCDQTVISVKTRLRSPSVNGGCNIFRLGHIDPMGGLHFGQERSEFRVLDAGYPLGNPLGNPTLPTHQQIKTLYPSFGGKDRIEEVPGLS